MFNAPSTNIVVATAAAVANKCNATSYTKSPISSNVENYPQLLYRKSTVQQQQENEEKYSTEWKNHLNDAGSSTDWKKCNRIVATGRDIGDQSIDQQLVTTPLDTIGQSESKQPSDLIVKNNNNKIVSHRKFLLIKNMKKFIVRKTCARDLNQNMNNSGAGNISNGASPPQQNTNRIGIDGVGSLQGTDVVDYW